MVVQFPQYLKQKVDIHISEIVILFYAYIIFINHSIFISIVIVERNVCEVTQL